MRPANELEAVQMIKFIDYFTAENPARPSSTHFPGLYVFGVTPHHVTERSVIWDLHTTVYKPDLIQCFYIRGKTPVNTENTFGNNSGDREVI
jgi:hypothetical protein